ncbi:MAG: phosphohistidine phosphatase SixA [Chloroflexi bacterium]|nr:MAG: phosphohistidine phosphatase SixA [Chloroflexota bacterium]
MELYFLRHALAGDRMDWKEDDRLRPLTEEGKKRTASSAEKIARLNLGLDAIITSPLVRARQTAEIVADRLDMRSKMVEDESLAPGFGPKELSEILEKYPDANALMVVGHEPDFSDTISTLIGGGDIVCKKGGLVRVTLLNVQALEGQLVWLIPPKILAGN